MRLHQLLAENDYNEDLRSEIITLLTAVSAEGIDEVDTQNLLNDLEMQGFAVDEGSLLELLGTLDIVSTADSDKIEIATSDADMMVGQDAEGVEADRVDDLATNQATKGMGEDTDTPYDPAAQYRDMGTAELMAKKNYGLGKQRDFARDELARRGAAGEKWKWGGDAAMEPGPKNEGLDRLRKLAGLNKG
jgi:hypothetical protein